MEGGVPGGVAGVGAGPSFGAGSHGGAHAVVRSHTLGGEVQYAVARADQGLYLRDNNLLQARGRTVPYLQRLRLSRC